MHRIFGLRVYFRVLLNLKHRYPAASVGANPPREPDSRGLLRYPPFHQRYAAVVTLPRLPHNIRIQVWEEDGRPWATFVRSFLLSSPFIYIFPPLFAGTIILPLSRLRLHICRRIFLLWAISQFSSSSSTGYSVAGISWPLEFVRCHCQLTLSSLMDRSSLSDYRTLLMVIFFNLDTLGNNNVQDGYFPFFLFS